MKMNDFAKGTFLGMAAFLLSLGCGMICGWEKCDDLETAFQNRLLTDWARQDVGGETAGCFKNSKTFEKEERMLKKALAELGEFDESLVPPLEARFQELMANKVPANDPRWVNLYIEICQKRRVFRLEPVVESCPEIIFTKHYVMGASHYAYTEDVTDEAFFDTSIDRKPGGQLCKMKVHPDGHITTEVLYEVLDGTIRDPDVSYDGKRILFSMRHSFTADDFHLYEYSLETGKVRQLTFGTGVADIEPAYLPNGDIVFDSTRGIQLTDCWWTEVSNLFMCDGDGRFLRRVSFDQVTVNYPKVLSDGRVTYTRWDYNDRGHIFPQPLFVMNPDGTGQTEFYGNNSYFPTALLHARGIPGTTSKAIAVAGGHHAYQHGKLVLVDRLKGTQENEGCQLIAPVRPTPADRIDPYGQKGELFAYPYAIDETNFLVTYLPEGRIDSQYKIPFGVYYMDIDGNRELLAFDPAISCNQQVPLQAREVPTLRASQVDYSKKTGRYYVQNVYEGPGLTGIEPGTIKALRVVSLLYRPCAIGNNWNWGEAGTSNVSMPASIGNGTWDAKKVIGEVPVEADGSAYFEVPAMTPVYFQLLDQNYDTVQTMRSWSTLQPGELFACVGCHEPKENTISNVEQQSATIAIQKRPSIPKPLYEPGEGIYQDAGFSYIRDIQPILDENCVSCHTGEEGAAFSLTGDLFNAHDEDKPEEERFLMGGRQFSESYVTLTSRGEKDPEYINWIDIHSPPYMLKPYTAGAFKSPLIKWLREGWDENHKNVKLTDVQIRMLAMWIDLYVPFVGRYNEANTWTVEENAHYAFYIAKRMRMFDIMRKNMDLLAQYKKGEIALPAPETFDQFDFGGAGFKRDYQTNWIFRRDHLPSLTKRQGEENVYRNLAANPNDTQILLADVCPHAWTNSEYAYLDVNAAKNVLDGETAKQKNGAVCAWRPNYRRDAFLQVDLGHNAEIDKVVLSFDLSKPENAVWKTGKLEFSDGSSVDITFEKTDKPQMFTFDKRVTKSVRLTNLTWERLAEPKAITEMEVWGTSCED